MSEDSNPFETFMGVSVLETEEGYAKASLKATKEHINSMGVVHGGAIFTLADSAFANAANYGKEEAVAIQANISFMKPARKGETLTAEAFKISESKKIGFYKINITTKKRSVALFTGIVYRKK